MPASKLKRVRIRMYRGILGDCFLLRAEVEKDGVPAVKSVLIDCGVLHNVAAGPEMVKRLAPEVVQSVGERELAKVLDGPTRIKQVAQDLLTEVGNHIDLLVITHEHYDHLSGFAFSKEAFLDKRLTIDRLWMAWTEDFSDKQANSLRARLSKGRQALAAAAELAGSMGVDAPEALLNAAALAAFVGPPSGGPGLAAVGRFGTGEIMQMLKDKVGSASTEFLEPGQVIDLDGFGMKAYVLGPPRNETLLKKDSPSAGAAKEVYLTRTDAAAAAESAASTRLALRGMTMENLATYAELTPFSAVHLRPFQNERRKHAKPDPQRPLVEALYGQDGAGWRKIDDAWSESIEALALKMDSDTNNTSLALAFELPDGQVLLFPGDAQVGNWLSWNDQSYPKRKPGDGAVKTVTAEELLRRTTFYKVGHHASHNATAKALGLERMTDPRLVAAIPVVEAVAAVQGKGRSAPNMGWKMPYPALYAALGERTRDRIVRGDGDAAAERKAFGASPTDDRRPVKIAHAERDDLWVELTFELG